MSLELTKEQRADIIQSLQRYFREEFESELSEMQAGFFLEYLGKEITPLAYNKGVEDAQKYFLARTEELSGTCFEEAFTFWMNRKGNPHTVRRKPDR